MSKLYTFAKLLFTNPLEILNIIIYQYPKIIKSDKIFLSLRYYLVFGKWMNWNKPLSYSEKLQWLKVNNRNPLYTTLVDKHAVKEWVANKIGNEHIIPTIGIWDNVEDINFDKLPNQFVLKCTHDSGGLCICRDKSKLDILKIKENLSMAMNRNYYYFGREWPYKNVKPQIIAEKYMIDESGIELKDYKFFCFNGNPLYLFIATDRGKMNEEVKFDFYDINFNHLDLKNGHPNSKNIIKKPKGFNKMLELAKILSADMPHVRIDFYDIDGNIYFGEYTFYHHSGFMPFEPEEWDYKFGELIKLPS